MTFISTSVNSGPFFRDSYVLGDLFGHLMCFAHWISVIDYKCTYCDHNMTIHHCCDYTPSSVPSWQQLYREVLSLVYCWENSYLVVENTVEVPPLPYFGQHHKARQHQPQLRWSLTAQQPFPSHMYSFFPSQCVPVPWVLELWFSILSTRICPHWFTFFVFL